MISLIMVKSWTLKDLISRTKGYDLEKLIKKTHENIQNKLKIL